MPITVLIRRRTRNELRHDSDIAARPTIRHETPLPLRIRDRAVRIEGKRETVPENRDEHRSLHPSAPPLAAVHLTIEGVVDTFFDRDVGRECLRGLGDVGVNPVVHFVRMVLRLILVIHQNRERSRNGIGISAAFATSTTNAG